ANAENIVVERDVPEPALLVAGLDDHCSALVAAAVAVSAVEIGPHRALLEFGVLLQQVELIADDRALAAGVHNDLAGNRILRAIDILDFDAGCALAIEDDLPDARLLGDFHAV